MGTDEACAPSEPPYGQGPYSRSRYEPLAPEFATYCCDTSWGDS